jgi:hypothetical protein
MKTGHVKERALVGGKWQMKTETRMNMVGVLSYTTMKTVEGTIQGELGSRKNNRGDEPIRGKIYINIKVLQ